MPPRRTADKAVRTYRWGLALIAAITVAITAAFTYRDVTRDLQATEQANERLTAALAVSIDAHFDAALRDSTNAALSAVLLVEGEGGIARFGGERRLHEALYRELMDARSTARLVVADASGRVLASSAEYPVPPLTIKAPSRSWKVTRPGGHAFAIGAPERSVFDGNLVIPYFCDIVGVDGKSAGTLRAEVRVDHFTRVYLSTAELNQANVLILSDDGVILAQLPPVEGNLGGVAENLHRAIVASGTAKGDAELAAWPDDVPRFYSWRKVQGLPVTVAVGRTRDAVLRPWKERAQSRVVFAVLADGGLLLLIAALAVYVGNLSTSRQQLEDVESRYWIAMERSTVGIALMTVDGQLLHANPALCAMLGYTEAELLAMPFHLVTAEEDRPLRSEIMSQFVQGTMNSFEREKRLTRKDGSQIWVHAQSTVMRDARQQPANLISHLKDITQRKIAEQALRELNETLEERVAERTVELSRANKDLEAFSYSAAHDLRGPLARLAGFVDILGRDLVEGETQAGKRLAAIRRQVTEMNSVIDSLLALARTSRAPLHRERVDLASLVPAVMADVQPEGAQRAIEWKVGDLRAVRADPLLLREALVNLLGNAVKYTRGRDPAVIEISSELVQEGGEVVVRIADNGAGFDMEYVSHLFEPFRRLHTTSEFEGTGIGLAIVERIIERNGGRVWARGEPGQGATFCFALPAA